MDISISGTELTLTLDNTSPITFDSSTDPNVPGIVGFGFNLDPKLTSVDNWVLSAFADSSNTQPVTLGDQGGTYTSWVMGTKLPNDVERDFLPQSDEGGVKGGIYNPLATGGFAGTPNYFSTATLVMTFLETPILDPASVCVRMQNVGGGGSLKLFATPVPEPSSLVLFAIGGVALCGSGLRRRRRRKAAAES